MTPEQAGWAILTGFVIFGGELVVWFQGHLDRSRRAFIRAVRGELRSRARRGGSEEVGGVSPRPLSTVPAGVERRAAQRAAAPPAPQSLVGAADPRHAAPTRPQRIHLGGAW